MKGIVLLCIITCGTLLSAQDLSYHELRAIDDLCADVEDTRRDTFEYLECIRDYMRMKRHAEVNARKLMWGT